LSQNKLTGTIPPELGAIRALQEEVYVRPILFNFTGNQLTGTVPLELASQVSLAFLFISNNNITGSLDPLFCNGTALKKNTDLITLSADCDEVICSCCTECCDKTTGCELYADRLCDAGAKYESSRDINNLFGIVCSCVDNYNISCADTLCDTCTEDGSVCVNAVDYGLVIDPVTGMDVGFRCTEIYTSGPKEGVEIYYEHSKAEDYHHLLVMVDGMACQSSAFEVCNDLSSGLRIDCSNIEPDAVYSDCDPEMDGGELLQAFRWEFHSQNCYSCFPDFSAD
jgi:hypothetical protein